MPNDCDKRIAVLHFDPQTYSLNAIKKAAYQLGNRAYFQISPAGKTIEVRIEVKDSNAEDPKCVAGEFSNEVIDQDLRERISLETAEIRNLILAHAFSRTSLIEPDWDTADYSQDSASMKQPDSTSKSNDR